MCQYFRPIHSVYGNCINASCEHADLYQEGAWCTCYYKFLVDGEKIVEPKVKMVNMVNKEPEAPRKKRGRPSKKAETEVEVRTTDFLSGTGHFGSRLVPDVYKEEETND